MANKALTKGLVLPSGKSPRVTIAVEPEVAEHFRAIAKAERMELSVLLEQSLVAWLRKWRPEYLGAVAGPEGPPERVRVTLTTGPAMLRISAISRAEVESTKGFAVNGRGAKKKSKKATRKESGDEGLTAKKQAKRRQRPVMVE